MTIAMGYQCWQGVIVAADTLVVIGQEAQEGTKLDSRWTNHGPMAFANSSEDGNATTTLVGDMFHAINATDNIPTYRELGTVIKASMMEWRRGFGGRKPPSTELILGAQVSNLRPRLFVCQPPNTFTEKDDYWAVGAGAAVTDPLYSTLFSHFGGEYNDVQIVLRRIAYLFYRAKKDHIYCGKNTECAIVPVPPWLEEPITVDREDLKAAETAMHELDDLLSTAAIFATSSDDSTLRRHADELGKMLMFVDSVRLARFHDRHGNVIKLSASRM